MFTIWRLSVQLYSLLVGEREGLILPVSLPFINEERKRWFIIIVIPPFSFLIYSSSLPIRQNDDIKAVKFHNVYSTCLVVLSFKHVWILCKTFPNKFWQRFDSDHLFYCDCKNFWQCSSDLLIHASKSFIFSKQSFLLTWIFIADKKGNGNYIRLCWCYS